MKNKIRIIVLCLLGVLLGCKRTTSLSIDDFKDGDVYELKEDVFLLPCWKGRLKPSFSGFLPFSTKEWQSSTNYHTKGWGRFVKGVVPQGTRLVIERKSKADHPDTFYRNVYGRFLSGPFREYKHATVIDLIRTNSPNNKTASRYLKKVK